MVEPIQQIKYEDFAKVDLRIGKIISCEPVEKSDKLLKLQVDFGELGQRQILSGIANWYTPNDLIGLKTAFVFNIEPRKIMGMDSQGMILGISSEQTEKPELFEAKQEIEPGCKVF